MKKLRGSIFDQPVLTVVQNHLVRYPTPSNLNGNYNWGVQAGLCLVLQILTGIFLAMHYTAHVDQAFHSVQHLMRDVPNGWLLRYLHANGASLFFIVVYMHQFRALYYTSYASPREFVWLVGVVIQLVMIQTAFIGYVLPWGQMSQWGRTVITSQASALPVVGTSIVGWLWGGFAVDNPTQNRFYSFHYLFPFLQAALSLVHLAAQHQYGSTNPQGIQAQTDLVDFYRAPLCFYVSLFFMKNQYSCTYTHIGYVVYTVKHTLGMKGQPLVPSQSKSRMTSGDKGKKYWRAKSDMVKLMNLIYSPSGIVEPVMLFLIMHNRCHGFVLGRDKNLRTVGITTFNQKGKGLQEPKPDIWGNKRTMAWPTTKQGVGQRASVVGRVGKPILANNTRYYATEGRQAHTGRASRNSMIQTPRGGGAEALKALHTQAIRHRDKPFKGLIYAIAHPETLILAYEQIKSKPGNITKGTTPETLDGLSMDFIHKTSKRLISGHYQFTPAREVLIPKPGKREKRPLKVANPREKLVQKSMELVLNAIYDCTFMEYSHGFRPGKGCHTALKYIDQKFKGVVWFIEADITKCFDTIPHDQQITILRKKVQCQKTIALIQSSLQAGHIQVGGMRKRSLLGTPQGSILSPLLCNIYMHELDKYMNQLISDFNRGKKRKANPRYISLMNILKKAKTVEEKQEQRKLYRKQPRYDLMDRNFRRLSYVRYADDFLIGIIRPRTVAEELMQMVGTFLKEMLRLELNLGKTKLTHARQKAAHFLGTDISWNSNLEKKVVTRKESTVQSRKKVRVQARISQKRPILKLVKKLIERKFFEHNPNGQGIKPHGLTRMMNFDHADILKYYNTVIREITNYYSFVDNIAKLSSIVEYMRYSCRLTQAKKYKLRTMGATFKRFGKKLTCKKTGTSFYQPSNYKRTRQFNIGAITQERLEKSWAGKLTRSNQGKTCIVYGSVQVQMHHLRTIKDLKRKHSHLDWFKMQMAAINQKQVPLCREHHKAVHKNTLTRVEKELFVLGCKRMVSNKPKSSDVQILCRKLRWRAV